VSKLVDFWFKGIKNGRVLHLYPFLGVFETLYYNKKEKLRCGAGYANYTITTKGDLSACPIMNSVKDFYCGDIESGPIKEIHCKRECLKCNVFHICGGRCLYSNYAQLWPKEGQDLICKTVKHLIKEIERVLPQIKNMIKKGVVKESDFKYEKYFGPEIIP
jgi:radical SAM protein with 4Fe4S-binding SPASM domain